MAEAAEAQDFERAALFRDRLNAVQQPDGAPAGRRQLDGQRGPDRGRRRGDRRQRPGLPGPRRGAGRAPGLLSGRRRRSATPAEVAESFLLQYYTRGAGDPAARGRRPRAEGPHRGAGRGPRRRARLLGRGPGRRARRPAPPARAGRAQRRAGAGPGQAAPRAPPPAAGRGARRRCRASSGLERLPVRIEALRHLQPRRDRTRSPRWSSSRAARRRSPTTASSRSAATATRTAASPTTSQRCDEVLTRRMGRYMEQADLSPHDANRDASFAALPDLIVIDGGKGQLSAGHAAPWSRWSSGAWRWSASRSGSRRSSCPGRRDPIRARARLRRAAAAAAGARRGAPLRDHLPPQQARPGDDGLGAGRGQGRRARPASARCCGTSARPSGWSRPAARSWKRCPGCPVSSPARSTGN